MTNRIAQIDLLRHGETKTPGCFCGHTDTHLSEAGWQQMWRRVEQAPQRWCHIITSPLNRCAHFAQQLARYYEIPVTVDTRLKEIHFGAWEGRSAADLMAQEPDAIARFWQNPLAYPPPESEHLNDFRMRILAAWNDIQMRLINPIDQRRQHILIVTHGGVMRVLYCHFRNQPLEKMPELEVPYATMQSIMLKRQDNTYHAAIKACSQV